MSGDRIDLLAEIHRLKEENNKLEKALDKAVSFIYEYPRGFACPYEIDDEDYMISWSKCSKCGTLKGQEIKCWKEWCLGNVDQESK